MFQQKKVISASGPNDIDIGQAGTVMPEKTYRVTVERVASATGTVAISGRYILCDGFNALQDENGSAVAAISLASLTEPRHFYITGDIEKVRFTGASISGSYNAIVCGW